MALPKFSPAHRQALLNFLRIGVSVTLLVVVLAQINLARLAQTLSEADPRLYAAALGLGLIGVALRAWRWKVLLDAVGARVPYGRLLYLYFVGAFFNAFLPTGFGGDVVRVLEFGPGADKATAAGTTIVDRLTGFIMLFALALVALPFALDLVPGWLLALIGAMAAAVLVGSLFLFEGNILQRVTGALTARLPGRLQALSLSGDGWLARMYAVITACGRGALLRALGVSLVFNSVLLSAAWLLAGAFRLEVTLPTLLVCVPVATASLLLPISVSGLGVREGIYVLLFAQVGVGQEQALAFSFAYYSIDLFAGLLGGLIYLLAGLIRLRRRV